ncbi:MAG TPA: hypothetical protein VF762_23650, partial [Blastocatellia bacterium]
ESALELRHGMVDFITDKGGSRSRTNKVQATRPLVRQLVEKLRKQGLSEEKIKRLVEAEVLRLFLRQAFREIILLLFTL